MRIFTTFLLTLALASPALAQNQPLRTGVPAQSGTNTAEKPLTADGKIQIGYDKRVDYPTIKQGAAAKAAEKSTAAATPNDPSRMSLDGNLIAPGSPIANQRIMRDQAGNIVSRPPIDSASRPTSLTGITPAVPARPRGDSALKGDSAALNPVSPAATRQPTINNGQFNGPSGAIPGSINNNGSTNNANGFNRNTNNTNPNNGFNPNNNTNGNNNSNSFGGPGFIIVNGRPVRQ